MELGDFSWHNVPKTIEIFNSLNGTKRLCVGNHDKRLLKHKNIRDLFAEITDYKEITFDDGTGLVMCHYPIPCFNNHYYNWIHLYGHVHTSFEWSIIKQTKYDIEHLFSKPCRMYNVGCMVPGMDYTPKTLKQILEKYETEQKEDTDEEEC